MNRRVRFLSRLTSFSYRSSRGEIATTAVLIGIGIIALGVVVSRLISQQPGDQDTRSMAANPPTVPNCYNLSIKDSTGTPATTLTVGQSYSVVADFSLADVSKPTEHKGEFFLDSVDPTTGASSKSVSNGIFNLGYPLSQGKSYAIMWTPTASDVGNHTLNCRAWNDSISECRPAGLVDGLPRYTCDGPTSQVAVTVQNPAPLSCDQVTIIGSTPVNNVLSGALNPYGRYEYFAKTSGGTPPYTYTWTFTDPAGNTIGTQEASTFNVASRYLNTPGSIPVAGQLRATVDIRDSKNNAPANAASCYALVDMNIPVVPVNTPTPTVSPCSDSDNGQILDVFGQVVQTYADGNTVTYNDACQLSGMIRETYCDASGVARMQDFSCPAGTTCASGTGVCAAPAATTGTVTINGTLGANISSYQLNIKYGANADVVCLQKDAPAPGTFTATCVAPVPLGQQSFHISANHPQAASALPAQTLDVTAVGPNTLTFTLDPPAPPAPSALTCSGITHSSFTTISPNLTNYNFQAQVANGTAPIGYNWSVTTNGGTVMQAPTSGQSLWTWNPNVPIPFTVNDTSVTVKADLTDAGGATATCSVDVPITTTGSPDPMLAVTGDGGDGTFNLPGDTITVTVTHNGYLASSVQKFDVKVYNATGGLVALGVTMNATYANGVSSATGTLPANIFTAGGTYKLKAGAYSSGNTLPDLGVSADVPITVALAGTGASVDLHVKSTTHTEPATGIDVKTEIENLGTATWTIVQGDPFEIDFTLTDGTNTCTAVLNQNSITIGVAAGSVTATTNINPSATGWTCTPGALTLTAGTSYTLTTKLDPNNKQPESDETNNTNTYTFTYGSGAPGVCTNPITAGPTGLTPINGTTINAGAQDITWGAVTGAGQYAIRINEDPEADGIWRDASGNPIQNCSQSMAGNDKCVDDTRTVTGGTLTSFPYTFVAGKTYKIWVHALSTDTACQDASHAKDGWGVYTTSIVTAGTGTTHIPTNGFTVTVNAPNGGEQLVAGTATTISWRARTTTAADVGQYDTIIRVNYDKVGGGTSHWTLCGEGTAPACPKSNVTGSVPGGTVTYSWTPTKAEIPANAIAATYKARVVLMPPTGYPPAQLKKDSNGFSYLDSDSSNAPFDIVDAGTVTNTPIPTLTGTTPAPGGTCQVTTNFDAQGGLTPSSPYTFNNTGDTRRLEVNATLADGRTVERICFTLAGGSGYARDDIWDGYIISTDDNCESVTTSDNTPDTRIYAVNSHTSSKPYSTLIMDVSVAQGGGYVRCTAERYFTVNSACGYDQQKGGDFNCDGTANKTDINFGKTLLKMLIRGAQATLGGFTRGELEELIASLQRK